MQSLLIYFSMSEPPAATRVNKKEGRLGENLGLESTFFPPPDLLSNRECVALNLLSPITSDALIPFIVNARKPLKYWVTYTRQSNVQLSNL